MMQQQVIVLPACIKGTKSLETKEIDAKTRENKIIKSPCQQGYALAISSTVFF